MPSFKMNTCQDMPSLEDENMSYENNAESVNHDVHFAKPISSACKIISKSHLSIPSTDDDSDNETSWNDEDELLQSMKSTICLFCDLTVHLPEQFCEHLAKEHNFHIKHVFSEYKFDQIKYIKFINFVRKRRVEDRYVEDILCREEWLKDEYMIPTFEDDPLLMVDLDDFMLEEEKGQSGTDVSRLIERCIELEEIVQKQHKTLKRLLDDATDTPSVKEIKTVGDLNVSEDKEYFNSYAYYDIHHEMLSDEVRTESYRDAAMKNSESLKGKCVLDLGCGTGILSMFCARAGASSVIGVDMSDVLYSAMEIVNENGLSNVIELHKGRVEDLDFGCKFDYIISEWMGYFLLFEGMLDSVLYARDHHLKEGGKLLPSRCTMLMAGVENLDDYAKIVEFWDDVYGFKMTCMKKQVFKEAIVNVMPLETVATNTAQIADLDLMKITSDDIEFECTFVLTASRDCSLTCIIGYFDIYFEMPVPVYFSTGPHAKSTHWKQTIFYLPQPKHLRKDETLECKITVERQRKEIRNLLVKLSYEGKSFKFLVQ